MDASAKVRRLAAWSIPVAFGVMGLKYVAYALTGSVALYSDALESIVNVIAAIGAWWAIQVSYPARRRQSSLRAPQGGIYFGCGGGRSDYGRRTFDLPRGLVCTGNTANAR